MRCLPHLIYACGLSRFCYLTSTMLHIEFFCMVALASTITNQVLATDNNPLVNKHLKVAAEHFKPYIIFYCNGKEMEGADKCPDKGTMAYGGALWELLKLVKSARNVTISILRPPTPSWGYCHGVNNCTGMIGMVNRKEVDFALGIFIFH